MATPDATSSAAWPEIIKAKADGRHEIVLSGPEISKRISERPGLDLPVELFALHSVNYLDISGTSLQNLSDLLGELEMLQNLVLRNNKLTSLPSTIGKLKRLKFLDVSGNELSALPSSIGDLEQLYSLNAKGNQIGELPGAEALSGLVALHLLDVSHNRLRALPAALCSPKTVMIDTIIANDNQIATLPAELSHLQNLKILDLDNNLLVSLPVEIAKNIRLKELRLRNNKFADKRFFKLVHDKKMATKQLLDYLAINADKARKGRAARDSESARTESADADADVGDAASGAPAADEAAPTSGAGEPDEEKENEDATAGGDDEKASSASASHVHADRRKKKRETPGETIPLNRIRVLPPPASGGVEVRVSAAVATVRPYIVCCIIHGLDLSGNNLKHFLALQTKLHDTVCDKRQAATIATHELKAIRGPLLYDARNPERTTLTPLGRTGPNASATARQILNDLHREADDYRKQHKRNTVSGIHKYLGLLKGKNVFPFLVDSNNEVISFPPITNAELTKMSKTTEAILVEVTSSLSLDACRHTADELLAKVLELGCCARFVRAPDGSEHPEPTTPPGLPNQQGAAAATAAPSSEPTSQSTGAPAAEANKVFYEMSVEQVRVITAEDGSLRSVYPSRADLSDAARYNVIRD